MPSSEHWLLRDVTVDGRHVDCRLRDGVVAELGTELAVGDARVIMAAGGALLPGLADHHIHIFALAAARASLDLRGSSNIDDAAEPPGDGWGRVIGADAKVTRAELDRRWPDRPVRVQHRSGRLWTLNSAGVNSLDGELIGDEARTGQLWDADQRLRALVPAAAAPDVAAVGRELAGYGVTHLSDASPELSTEEIGTLRRQLPQRLMSMAAAGDGPRKIVLSDAALPDLGQLCRSISEAHASDRSVAVHTVSAWTLALALAAFTAVGTRGTDRLEHAAVCDDAAAERVAELGLTVVTQPTIFARHGARFLDESPPEDRHWLWRLAGLRDRGVRVAVSSDAPYGDPDPAATLRACVTRPVEGIAAAAALAMMLSALGDPAGPVRSLELGTPADLCLLSGRLDIALEAVIGGGSWPVRATFIGGRTELSP